MATGTSNLQERWGIGAGSAQGFSRAQHPIREPDSARSMKYARQMIDPPPWPGDCERRRNDVGQSDMACCRHCDNVHLNREMKIEDLREDGADLGTGG